MQGAALHYACAGGFVHIAQALLDHKADLNAIDGMVRLTHSNAHHAYIVITS